MPTPAAVTTRLYAALAADDRTALAALLHRDAVLHVPGTSPVSGTYRGAAGLLEFTATSRAIAPGGATTEVRDVLDGGTHAAVVGVSRAAREGRSPLENHTVHLVEVHDGRVTAVTFLNRDQALVDAFWS